MEEKRHYVSYVFVGCILIGIATGLFFDRVSVGTLGGVGLGFILWGILTAKK